MLEFKTHTSNLKNITTGCRCSLCLEKYERIFCRPPNKWRTALIVIIIPILWSIFFFGIYNIKESNNSSNPASNLNPYEILDLEPDASMTEIKRAFRKMSLLHHPDHGGNVDLFMAISNAYRILTDPVLKENWEMYGDPEGPKFVGFGIALPVWMVEKENSSLIIFAYFIVFAVIGPSIVAYIWWKFKKNDSTKILKETQDMFYHFCIKTPDMTIQRIVMILSACFEFSPTFNKKFQTSSSDATDMPKLLKQLDLAINKENKREQPFGLPFSIKARCLMLAHFNRIDLAGTNLKLVQLNLLKIILLILSKFIQSIVELIVYTSYYGGKELKFETMDNALKLSSMIVQGLNISDSSLLQLPHVTQQDVNNLLQKKRNIRTIEQYALLSSSKRKLLTGRFDDVQKKEFKATLKNFPKIFCSISIIYPDDEQTNITANSLVTLDVKLVRKPLVDVMKQKKLFLQTIKETKEQNKNKKISEEFVYKLDFDELFDKEPVDINKLEKNTSPHVHCPLLPSEKREGWWLYIFNNTDKKLIFLPIYITCLNDTLNTRISFPSPSKPGLYSFTVFLTSDSYIKYQEAYPLKFEVLKQIQIDPGIQYDFSSESDDIEDDELIILDNGNQTNSSNVTTSVTNNMNSDIVDSNLV